MKQNMVAVNREYDGYKALWGAVLVGAIKQMDSSSEADRAEASKYVFETKENPTSFRWICTMLQLDPDALQTACMSREARADLARRKYMRD